MKYLYILVMAISLLAVCRGEAELQLASVFTDNMVLQRDKPLPVWGNAEAGQAVSVHFAGRTKIAHADVTGDWRVLLDPLRANGEPRTLVVVAENSQGLETEHQQLTNVLVGEVWLAAGQSNMEFPLSREAHAAQEIPACTNTQIRLLNLSFADQSFYSRPFGSNEVLRLSAGSFFKGKWRECSPSAAENFSAIAYYFSREIHGDLNVPIGIINCSVGGSPTEAWIPRAAFTGDSELKMMTAGNWLTNATLDDWCRLRGHQNLDTALANGLPVPSDDLGPNHEFKPAFLWNAGPARLAPFALRGVLWYQGESNALEERRVQQHKLLFPLLVHGWRSAWHENIPFLFCQLSSILTNGYHSAFWPEFRDQQRRFLETIPNTGMAVTSDQGLPNDVHPREKREIGRRLALVARARVYGERIEFGGPQPERAVKHDGIITLSFSHCGGLMTDDGQSPRGFEIAGADGSFHPAITKIERESILFSSPGSLSCAVRYGWQPFSTGNLINSAGLPASTFEITITSN